MKLYKVWITTLVICAIFMIVAIVTRSVLYLLLAVVGWSVVIAIAVMVTIHSFIQKGKLW